MVKAGVMLHMLPTQAHDFVLQTFGTEVKYEETAERMRTFVANKAAMTSGSGPVPMDVGHAHAECHGERDGEEEWDDDEVASVSMNTQCHTCHRRGHVRRDCLLAHSRAGGDPSEVPL